MQQSIQERQSVQEATTMDAIMQEAFTHDVIVRGKGCGLEKVILAELEKVVGDVELMAERLIAVPGQERMTEHHIPSPDPREDWVMEDLVGQKGGVAGELCHVPCSIQTTF